MRQLLTEGIVLSRTNYQEADRILTLLTPDYGKVRVLAKGVRKSKSKMAGGIELFSRSEIGFIKGKGELCTLTSSRLIKYYDTIVQDINRTMLGYELIKLLNKVTEDAADSDYFDLLINTFEALDTAAIHPDLVKLWFYAQLLRIAGHTPNLRTDTSGKALDKDDAYEFDYEEMAFRESDQGVFNGDHIKFLRLALSGNKPRILQQITTADKLILPCLKVIQTILPSHIRT